MGRNVIQKLWVDNATHLVRKDVSDEGSQKLESVFHFIESDAKLLPDLFVFNPASSQAQNRIQLAREAPATLKGKPAPDFTLSDLDGREVRLSDLRGKPVLLDFWATLVRLLPQGFAEYRVDARGLEAKGLLVFGVEKEPEIARAYLGKNGYTLRSLVDRQDEAVKLYRLEGWPTTVLIDREGKVAYYGLVSNRRNCVTRFAH